MTSLLQINSYGKILRISAGKFADGLILQSLPQNTRENKHYPRFLAGMTFDHITRQVCMQDEKTIKSLLC